MLHHAQLLCSLSAPMHYIQPSRISEIDYLQQNISNINIQKRKMCSTETSVGTRHIIFSLWIAVQQHFRQFQHSHDPNITSRALLLFISFEDLDAKQQSSCSDHFIVSRSRRDENFLGIMQTRVESRLSDFLCCAALEGDYRVSDDIDISEFVLWIRSTNYSTLFSPFLCVCVDELFLFSLLDLLWEYKHKNTLTWYFSIFWHWMKAFFSRLSSSVFVSPL